MKLEVVIFGAEDKCNFGRNDLQTWPEILQCFDNPVFVHFYLYGYYSIVEALLMLSFLPTEGGIMQNRGT